MAMAAVGMMAGMMMGQMMGGNDTPMPAPAPSVPAPDPEVAEELSTEQTRNAKLRRKVHGETLMTGPQGDTLEEEETSIKTLLGS